MPKSRAVSKMPRSRKTLNVTNLSIRLASFSTSAGTPNGRILVSNKLLFVQFRFHRSSTEQSIPKARFDLALALFGSGRAESAIEELLQLVRLDRDWNEQAARNQLVKIFDAMGPTNPLTTSSRRQLSSILFS